MQAVLAVTVLTSLALIIRPGDIAASFSTAAPLPILLALGLLVPNIGLQFLKWRAIVRRTTPGVEDRSILASLFVGLSLGAATPARLGEFGGRAWSIPGARPSVVLGLTALDKFFTLIMTLAAGAVATPLFLQLGGSAVQGWIVISLPVAAGIAAGLAALFMPALVLPRMQRHRGRWRTVDRICAALEAIDRFRIRDFLLLLLLSALFLATFTTQFCVLLAAFGPVDPFTAVVGVTTVMFMKTIIPPVTVGELGIREGAAVLVLSRLGYAPAAAFNASLLLFTINIVLPGLVGILFLRHAFRGERRA